MFAFFEGSSRFCFFFFLFFLKQNKKNKSNDNSLNYNTIFKKKEKKTKFFGTLCSVMNTELSDSWAVGLVGFRTRGLSDS